MRALLNDQTDCRPAKTVREIEKEVASFFDCTYEKNGCIINTSSFADFEQAEEEYSSKTGTEWECACNEMYFSLSGKTVPKTVVLTLLEALEKALAEKFPHRTFKLVISAERGRWASVRGWFHVLRPAETYFSEDIEDLSEPTLHKIINT